MGDFGLVFVWVFLDFLTFDTKKMMETVTEEKLNLVWIKKVLVFVWGLVFNQPYLLLQR